MLCKVPDHPSEYRCRHRQIRSRRLPGSPTARFPSRGDLLVGHWGQTAVVRPKVRGVDLVLDRVEGDEVDLSLICGATSPRAVFERNWTSVARVIAADPRLKVCRVANHVVQEAVQTDGREHERANKTDPTPFHSGRGSSIASKRSDMG